MIQFVRRMGVAGLFCVLLAFLPAVSFAEDTPCAGLDKQISALKQEIARLRDVNAMLLENLVNCGQEIEDLRGQINALKKKQNEKQN